MQKPGSKKKLLRSYTIDLQYCMFCNLCVEVCPSSSLYFNHNFELASFDRDAIKIVYDFPEALEMGATGEVELIGEDGGFRSSRCCARRSVDGVITAIATVFANQLHFAGGPHFQSLRKVVNDLDGIPVKAGQLEIMIKIQGAGGADFHAQVAENTILQVNRIELSSFFLLPGF